MLVTINTRAPRQGREIVCPECQTAQRVFHFNWEALECSACGMTSILTRWVLAEPLLQDTIPLKPCPLCHVSGFDTPCPRCFGNGYVADLGEGVEAPRSVAYTPKVRRLDTDLNIPVVLAYTTEGGAVADSWLEINGKRAENVEDVLDEEAWAEIHTQGLEHFLGE